MDYTGPELAKYQDYFPNIYDKFIDLMDEIEMETCQSLDPDVFLKIGKTLKVASTYYAKDCQSKKSKISICEDLSFAVHKAIGKTVKSCMDSQVLSGSMDELESEPLTITDIPSIYQERPFTTKHVERVLEVLADKYQIKLTLDDKEAEDIETIVSLDLDDIGLGAMDVKLFIPSLFMNKVNEYRKPDEVTFLYQEDYNFIEQVASSGNLENLVQLYATLEGRRKSTDKVS